MKLKRREKIMVGVTIGVVVVAALWFLLFAGDSRTPEQLDAEQTKWTAEIEKKELTLQAAARDAKRLAEWKRRALPPKTVLARSLYQVWLNDLIARSNFQHTTLSASENAAHKEQFTRLIFDLRARAGLGDVVRFLYEFYSAGFLHEIKKLDLKPVQGSHDLEVTMSIEAASLPTAVSKEQLSNEPRHDLQAAKKSKDREPTLADYRDPIVKRDFFAKYVPPTPDRPPRQIVDVPPRPRLPTPVDPADFAFITGVVEVDGSPRVFLHERMADKTSQLSAGQPFFVGDGKGVVQSIRPEGDVIVDFAGHRRLLHLGDNLYGGVEITDGPPKQTVKPANSIPTTANRNN
jgi:hypothetical protein